MSIQEWYQEECSECNCYNCDSYICDECHDKALKQKDLKISKIEKKFWELEQDYKELLKRNTNI